MSGIPKDSAKTDPRVRFFSSRAMSQRCTN